MSVFKLGLIGGGRMGQTHIRALKNSSQVQITAVVEPFPHTASKLRDMHFAVYDNFDQLLNGSKIDGLLVAAPTNQHLSILTNITKAGLPILSEKPCGLSSSEAREVGKAAEVSGVKLQVAYWRRFIPELRTLRLQIASGEIGEIHFLNSAQWDESPPLKQFRLASGGIFVDMAVHEIDQIRWLTGQEVKSASVMFYPQTEDSKGDTDSTQSLLEMSGGTISLVSLGRFHPGGDLVSAEIFASKSHQRFEIVTPATGERPQLEALVLQAESFANWARGGEQEGATSQDAEAALDIANMLKNSAGFQSERDF
jgi:myo-inositol 2-dehydrogenase/D-chiro-inositol 1-dehydrogenase